MDEFKLGRPALVCRWRLANKQLPLQNRHLRALAARRVNDQKISPALVAWAKQHVEWTLEEAATQHPDGVLMLVVDTEGKAAMSLGEYRPLKHVSANDLVLRATSSRREATLTGVSPEDLWIVRGDALVWGKDSFCAPSGACTLVDDLARTLGMPVRRDEDLLDRISIRGVTNEEVFLVSDEHGVVPASDHMGPRSQKFAAGYAKLLTTKRAR
jgi:hypothetical protein